MIRVLIVEDDFMVARIHGKFVNQTAGFRVVGHAQTGAEARRAVEENHPDLILLDVHLPDSNGLDLLHELRASRVPVGVIVITAAREANSVRAAVEGGAAHYLIKPFEYSDLVTQLGRFKERHQRLNRVEESVQDDVDKIFGFVGNPVGEKVSPLPKGLSVETARLVIGSLEGGGEMSASECADSIGLSRVSVRRYLEYFADDGQMAVRLEYGKAGRPERRYSLRESP
ncbi:response regulator [Arthrobacter sp. H14-L1]|uniref:response regulator n=1 Tax=Arthrobacter sp. H14-L1 TaxID=2996697 RepID=UPI002271E01A|nr:response regulator [Arthrobacter sp. H14-L1]MCY0904415.1 response regulator [Arthrobacter sp. H14-L1]